MAFLLFPSRSDPERGERSPARLPEAFFGTPNELSEEEVPYELPSRNASRNDLARFRWPARRRCHQRIRRLPDRSAASARTFPRTRARYASGANRAPAGDQRSISTPTLCPWSAANWSNSSISRRAIGQPTGAEVSAAKRQCGPKGVSRLRDPIPLRLAAQQRTARVCAFTAGTPASAVSNNSIAPTWSVWPPTSVSNSRWLVMRALPFQ